MRTSNLGTVRDFRPVVARRATPPAHSMRPCPSRTLMARAEQSESDIVPVAQNRRARHEYQIIDSWECGIVLKGSEVKAMREKRANITDAFGIVRKGEVFLLNMHVSPYDQASHFAHEPTRTRKLLLHKKEIRRLIGAVERQGLTLVPLELYFRNGVAKVRLALAKGKKLHDKREDARRRDDQREMERALRSR